MHRFICVYLMKLSVFLEIFIRKCKNKKSIINNILKLLIELKVIQEYNEKVNVILHA